MAAAAHSRLTSRYADIPSHVRLNGGVAGEETSAALQQFHKDREMRRREAQLAAVAREMEECTFQPSTNSGVPAQATSRASHVQIPGTQSHLARQQAANAQRAERQRREDKAFLTHAEEMDFRYRLVTVPKPFKLSGSRHADSCERASEDRSARTERDDADLTFQPQTGYSERKVLVSSILNEV